MLAGHNAVCDLSEEDLRALDLNTAAITGLKLIGFERRLPWWDTLFKMVLSFCPTWR
jgi:hypothetical protein